MVVSDFETLVEEVIVKHLKRAWNKGDLDRSDEPPQGRAVLLTNVPGFARSYAKTLQHGMARWPTVKHLTEEIYAYGLGMGMWHGKGGSAGTGAFYQSLKKKHDLAKAIANDLWKLKAVAGSPSDHDSGGRRLERELSKMRRSPKGKRHSPATGWFIVAKHNGSSVRVGPFASPLTAEKARKVLKAKYPKAGISLPLPLRYEKSPVGSGKVRYFKIIRRQGMPEALGYDANGRVVNAINGDRNETEASIRKAVHQHWPGAHER